jgi:hypothetical protein
MVSGAFAADAKMMPLVRVLIDECGTTRGLAEAAVGPDGTFNVLVKLPEGETPGLHNILVVGGGSSDSGLNLNPPVGKATLSPR